MSTVLEAVREQQRGAAGVAGRAPAPIDRTWKPPWRLMVAMAVVLLGVAIVLVVMRRRDTRRAEPKVTPVTLPHVPVAPVAPAAAITPNQLVPAAAPAAHSSVGAELPRGHIAENNLAPPKRVAVPNPKQAPQAKPHSEAVAPASHAVAPPSLRGNAGVRLKSIHYSAEPTKRTVTLLIGTAATTLHEGESVRDVEVQLILPDIVYIRNGSSVAAIAATP